MATSITNRQYQSSSTSNRIRYFSVDVECFASGPRHDQREVALIAVVDENEQVVLERKIKWERHQVFNYLTPLTGLKEGDLDDGVTLDEAIADTKRILGPDVILVGQSIHSDIAWLRLVEGVDYSGKIELAELFKVYSKKYRSYTYFTLGHEANTLLEKGMIDDQHSPATDAIASIKLFKKYYNNEALLREARSKLVTTPRPQSWAKRNNYNWEGVCMGGFASKSCFCGAPRITYS